jgi:ribokinase
MDGRVPHIAEGDRQQGPRSASDENAIPATPEVLGFGAVAVDDFLYVDRYPAADSKVRVHRRLRQCGGLTGTALVAAARLGARCSYVGLLGDDPLSREVAACFDREGIAWHDHAPSAVARPAHSTIVVDRTAGTRTVFSSVDGPLGAAPDWPPAEQIRRCRALLIDHHGMEGTLRAARIARRSGVAVVADFERDPGSGFAEVLALVDHLIISRRFAETLTGEASPQKAAAALWAAERECVVVTCGAEGCWYVDRRAPEAARHGKAFPVDVVDTTGCGDVFHGAYAVGLCNGFEIDQRVLLASAAAGLAAGGEGGQGAIAVRRQVDQFIAQHGA